MVKKRKISKKDWNNVGAFIKKQLDERQSNKFRKIHEQIWTEVDRQVCMEPLDRKSNDADAQWRSALELGELSRASEIISADIRRLSFPQNRTWNEAHAEIEGQFDPLTGQMVKDKAIQKRIDGSVRALMTQQHIDFGLKARVDLSVKEAIHHGSYVATVEWENSLFVEEGSNVKNVSSPVWVPHSMWNCYPDSSASISGANAFYQGSMIITTYMKYDQLQKLKKPYFNLDKIEKSEKDIEITNYYGDITITRQDGDMYLPNCKVMCVQDNVIFYEPNASSFPKIIYNGWEKLDVRNPYFVSPVTKMSPTHKLTTIMANNFIDQVEQHTRPPIEYDGNDVDYAASGGPNLAPGSKNARKGSSSVQEIKLGDPGVALSGVQFGIDQLQKGTSVDNIRSGVSGGTEQTAFEVSKISQGSEIRTVDFVDKHELHGLRPFLYMQHDLNKKKLTHYTFFNPEMDAPDFERVTKADLPQNVHFEIVGSKGILGEEQRTQRTSAVVAFWMDRNPQLINQIEVAKEMFMDAGNKNGERFLNIPTEEDQGPSVEELQFQVAQEREAFEREKAQAELELKAADSQAKQQEIQGRLEVSARELEIKEGELRLKEAELELKAQEIQVKREEAQQANELRKYEIDANVETERNRPIEEKPEKESIVINNVMPSGDKTIKVEGLSKPVQAEVKET